jgi:hypothetical protein
MNLISSWRVAILIAFVSLSVSHISYANSVVTLNFDLDYSGSEIPPISPVLPSETGYFAYPELQSLPDPRPTETEVYSPSVFPDGGGSSFHGHLDAGETVNFSTGSDKFGTFSDFQSALNTTGWTLRTDANTPNPTDYLFNVNASNLSTFAVVPVVFVAGTQGATFSTGSRPTFKWSGPTGFDTIDFALFSTDADPPIEHVRLGPAVTSYTIQTPLPPGSYQLSLVYSRDVTSAAPINPSVPINGTVPFADWGGTAQIQEEVDDVATFSVVPEPASLVLIATGALVLFPRRRAACCKPGLKVSCEERV